VYFVTPNGGSQNDIVLYLAYSSAGLGHYDALISKDDASNTGDCGLSTKVVTKCRCGVNSKLPSQENYLSCSHSIGRYSSCKCLSAGKKCSVHCSCKGCNNPNGKRPIASKTREREPHAWQLMDITYRIFMEKKVKIEQVEDGRSWRTLYFAILFNI
jgi:hypothetical protein